MTVKKSNEAVRDFYLGDFEGTLFPMETCKFLIEHSAQEISDFIAKISDPNEKNHFFLSQETVFAAKPKHHLRRTLKLDPIAEFYLYEMAYKNKSIFRKNKNSKRYNVGYRFSNGIPIPVSESYKEFNSLIKKYKDEYKYFMRFDISAYFNSIYHHDITNWFSSQKVTQTDVQLFGQFMREINTGFSIDFLPHGLYPSKMLGSHFLSYIDYSELIKSEQMLRFMDDFIIFSNNKDLLVRDFETIQKLLGQKSLNLNSEKTVIFSEREFSIKEKVDEVKEGIFEKFQISLGSGIETAEYTEVVRELSREEVEYLLKLLNDDSVADTEAGLVLDCVYEHTSDFAIQVANFIYKFPYLAKKIYHKCELIEDKNGLTEGLLSLLSTAYHLSEYQLFWIARITESYLLETENGGKILAALYEHKDSTTISKAKILEIPELRFGMPEWREIHLKNGSSSWLSWSSAIGMRNDSNLTRNYLMGYFSKSSAINKLIGECVINYKIPPKPTTP